MARHSRQRTNSNSGTGVRSRRASHTGGTMNRRVRVGNLYRFEPVFLDQIDARTNLKPGAIVRVVNLPSAPPANTMRHCHVATPDGEFIGLVHTNSLQPVISR